MSIKDIIVKSNLDEEESLALMSKFEEYQAVANEWKEKADSIIIIDESQTDLMKLADSGRKFLKGKRNDIEKTRKQLKESSLRKGQAIDTIAKTLTNLILPIEEDLTLKARFKEIKEEERKNKILVERVNLLLPYGISISQDFIYNMSEEAFSNYLEGAKINYENKLKAEELAEELRLKKLREEEAEKEKIRIENERLKAEAYAREQEIKRLQEEKEKIELKENILIPEPNLNITIPEVKPSTELINSEWELKWDDDSVYEFIKKYYKSDITPEQFIADSEEFLAENEFYNEEF